MIVCLFCSKKFFLQICRSLVIHDHVSCELTSKWCTFFICLNKGYSKAVAFCSKSQSSKEQKKVKTILCLHFVKVLSTSVHTGEQDDFVMKGIKCTFIVLYRCSCLFTTDLQVVLWILLFFIIFLLMFSFYKESEKEEDDDEKKRNEIIQSISNFQFGAKNIVILSIKGEPPWFKERENISTKQTKPGPFCFLKTFLTWFKKIASSARILNVKV